MLSLWAVGKAAIGGAIGGALFGVGGGPDSYQGLLGSVSDGFGAAFTTVFGKLGPYVQAGVNGAIGNALTQGAGMLFGMQKKFSWREVAASAVAGTVGYGAGKMLNPSAGRSLGNLAKRTVNGVITGATHASVTGGKIHFEDIVTDAFGNALGNSIVDASKPKAVDPMYDLGKANAKQEATQRSKILGSDSFGKLGNNPDLDYTPSSVSGDQFRQAIADADRVRASQADEAAAMDNMVVKGADGKPLMLADNTAAGGVSDVAVTTSNAVSDSSTKIKIEGFDDDRHNKHDALIQKVVNEINADKAGSIGATPEQAATIPDVDSKLVKAWMIQESGGSDKQSKAAWDVDPLQVNVPGDWNSYKSDLGLTEPKVRNTGDLETNLKAGVELMLRKGFGVSGQAPSNRPDGTFDGYADALRRYNGRTDLGDNGIKYSQNYSDRILNRANNPTTKYEIQLP